jgi:hypothetical protein
MERIIFASDCLSLVRSDAGILAACIKSGKSFFFNFIHDAESEWEVLILF